MSIDLHTFEPRKILICQQRQIGDVVISTACVELLRKRYPNAKLHFLTEYKCAPVLAHNPQLARVWTLKTPGRNDWSTLLRMRHEGFDLAIDLQQLPRTRWATRLSGAKVRLAGACSGYKRFFYNVISGSPVKGGYAGKIKAGILAPLDVEWDKQLPKMYVAPQELAELRAHLERSGVGPDDRLVTVDATHWSTTRRWFPEGFARAMDLAAERAPDLKFYLLYGPGERNTVQDIIRRCARPEHCLLPPEEPPNLRRTAAAIALADLHLGNCSAPRHFAVALGTPSLTIVGANGNTAWTFPSPPHQNVDMRVPCRKCNKDVCPTGTLECLRSIPPELVAERLLAMLGTGGPRRTPA